MQAVASHLTSSTGADLLVYDWPYTPVDTSRAAVLLIHALSSHSLRHQELVNYLLGLGFLVRAYDQYGNGASAGRRGHTLSAQHALEDLSDVIDNWRLEIGRELPLVLIGFGSGAVLAADLAQNQRADIAALVLSSPAFATHVPWGRRWLQRHLPFLYQRLGMGFRVGRLLSRNSAVRSAYQADPLAHHKITANTAEWLATTGAKLQKQAAQWRRPTLLLYAGADAVADTSATLNFIAGAKRHVESQSYPDMHHEIFNEPGKEQVYAHLKSWLKRHFLP